jgi:hypothetical protein
MLSLLSAPARQLLIASLFAATMAAIGTIDGGRPVRATKGPVSARKLAAKKREKQMRKAGRAAAKRGR